MSVRFGVFVPQGWRMDLLEIADPVEKYEAMTAVAREADSGSWDSVWLYDHFHTVPEPIQESVFECWTATSTLVRDTKRVNVGQMVGCNGYRNPALYAKIASTVDVAANGRLYAGIGAGWYEHEWRAYGYPWPELRDRMGAFREATEIIYRLWTENDVEFKGKYYTIDKPILEPKGVRKPHPSLWIGGGGPKVTLKLVAKYGDACNLASSDLGQFKEKLEILKRHCDDAGRDFGSIIKSTSLNVFPIEPGADPEKATAKARGRRSYEQFASGAIVGTVDEIKEKVQGAIDAGADYFIIYVPGVAYDHEPLQRLNSELLPAFS